MDPKESIVRAHSLILYESHQSAKAFDRHVSSHIAFTCCQKTRIHPYRPMPCVGSHESEALGMCGACWRYRSSAVEVNLYIELGGLEGGLEVVLMGLDGGRRKTGCPSFLPTGCFRDVFVFCPI